MTSDKFNSEDGLEVTYHLLQSRHENTAAALELAQQAKRTLAILTQDLEPALYNTREFAEAVQQLALRSRYSKIRILVMDPTRAIHDGHRLIELARKLSSFIQIRRLGEDDRQIMEAWLISDETGLLFRPIAERYEGFYDYNDPAQAREKLRGFNEVWERAQIDPELKRLHI